MNHNDLSKMIDDAEPVKKKKVVRYRKSKAVKQLEEAVTNAKKETSSFPYPAKQKFTDKDANGLTKCIIAYINLCKGCYAYRVNNTGVYDPATGKFRTSNTVSGIADISACVKGQFVQIEVKHGRDKMSKGQVKFRGNVQEAMGIYIIAKEFETFIVDFKKVFTSLKTKTKWKL